MFSKEDAYNQAMEAIKKGRSKEQVLLALGAFKNELAPLLEISSELLTLPKNSVPIPAMQRKYILAPKQSFWLNWMHISKFAGVSMSLMLLVSALTVTGYASIKSGPGQTLFQVKKSAEQLQLILSYNQEQKANLQLEITQKRLEEAKQIFNNPNSDPQQEQAALAELSNQTSNAIAVVNNIAKSNPASDKNHPLLNTLDSLTKEQENLLADIKSNSDISTETSSAQKSLTENSAKISEIKQYVAIASSGQSLAKLNADPNSVTILGEISNISKDQITVEKTVFTVTSQTIIKNSSGQVILPTDLKEKLKVNILALKNQNNLIAQQIFITSPDQTEAQVKGESTGTTTALTEKPTTTTPVTIKKVLDESATGTEDSEKNITKTDPNTAIGSFILEDPDPLVPKR